MKKQLQWIPTIIYGLFMMIFALVYNAKYDTTIMIGIILFSLILLIPLLILSLFVTLFRKRVLSFNKKTISLFYIILSFLCLLIAGSIIYQIITFITWSDWYIYAISLIITILALAISMIFITRDIKKERKCDEIEEIKQTI